MKSRTVFLTGYSGFIGNALANTLLARYGEKIVAPVRSEQENTPDGVTFCQCDLRELSYWPDEAAGAEVVIHAAARAHVLNDGSSDPLTEFRLSNTDATIRLARYAAESGVRRFIFISSIGVNGVSSLKPFTENDKPNPTEPYAISKYEAEQQLLELAKTSSMDVVIIRPPLVYGKGAPGNFGRLIKAVESGFPLPFGSIKNQRTLVGLDNLIDLVITCMNHPAAANSVFLAGDDEDISTTELLQLLGESIGKPARLIPIPQPLLEFLASLIGKKADIQRLSGSLQIDITRAKTMLNWNPPYSIKKKMIE